MFDKTTLEHWLDAEAGFELLDMVNAQNRRADVLRWIKRDLNAAQHKSSNARFQARCDELIAVVELELAELEAPVQAVA